MNETLRMRMSAAAGFSSRDPCRSPSECGLCGSPSECGFCGSQSECGLCGSPQGQIPPPSCSIAFDSIHAPHLPIGPSPSLRARPRAPFLCLSCYHPNRRLHPRIPMMSLSSPSPSPYPHPCSLRCLPLCYRRHYSHSHLPTTFPSSYVPDTFVDVFSIRSSAPYATASRESDSESSISKLCVITFRVHVFACLLFV